MAENKAKNNGIRINPKGIKILKLSSNVKELTIQDTPLKYKPNPQDKANKNKLKLNGFFL